MKEKIFSAFKKVAVILIASIMVLGIVPVGVLKLRPHTANAEGEFLRFSPVHEVSVMSSAEEKKYSAVKDEGLHFVGGKSHTYLQFDLQSLMANKKLAPIKEATLRLTAVRTGVENTIPLRIWLMPSSDWNRDMRYQDRPSYLGEIKIAELSVNPRDAEVVELDVTAYLQKWLEEEKGQISLHLDAGGDGIAAVFAGTKHEDALYRPCLKVVTGEAFDPDTEDVDKNWLEKSSQTGFYGNGEFCVGEGADTYLRFQLKPENIRAAMYQVNLKLAIRKMDADAEIKVFRLKNGDWQDGMTLPQGEEELIYTANASQPRRLKNMDLSHAVNDAYAKGETALTLRLTGGESGQIRFAGSGDEQPELEIKVSDHGDKTAVTEALIYALEDNIPEGVTQNLSEGYNTEQGDHAEVRWTAWDALSGDDASKVLDERGKITRPAWLEDSRMLRAKATVSSGDYTRQREYLLTVLPEEMPNYSQWKFDNLVNLGQSSDEEDHDLASRNTDSHIRWIGTKNFPYRTLQADSLMAMTLAVDPEKQNYLTLKIWNEDRPESKLIIENLAMRDLAPMVIEPPEEVAAEKGFLYLTYPLPMEQTKGRNHVTLRLRLEEAGEITREESGTWNLYGIYTGQSLYFDPLTFAEQGETFAGKTPHDISSFKRLLKRIYMLAKEPWEDFAEQWRKEDADVQEEEAVIEEVKEDTEVERFAWMDTQPPMLAFDDSSDRIAISLWEKNRTEIHRSTTNYDTYAEGEVKEYGDGLTAIDYYKYRIFRNISGRERRVPNGESLAGVYQDLVSGDCYAFLSDGQMADETALPEGAVLKDGSQLRIMGKSTVVLKLLAEPVESAQWRVWTVNDRPVSRLNLSRRLTVSRVSLKNTGYMPEKPEEMQVICCVYEKGMLVGIAKQVFTSLPETAQYNVELPQITIEPGQIFKIFVEKAGQLGEYTPKLALP